MLIKLVVVPDTSSHDKDMESYDMESSFSPPPPANLIEEAVSLVCLFAQHHGILHLWNNGNSSRVDEPHRAVTHMRDIIATYEKAPNARVKEFLRAVQLSSSCTTLENDG